MTEEQTSPKQGRPALRAVLNHRYKEALEHPSPAGLSARYYAAMAAVVERLPDAKRCRTVVFTRNPP